MKNLTQTIFCLVIFSFLIASCSQQRYTYYNINKNSTANVKVDKPNKIHTPVALNESVSEKNVKVTEPLAETSIKPVETSKKEEKVTAAKKVTKAIDQTLTSPFKAFANVPVKINKVFPNNSNTMEVNAGNREGGGGLLWTIIIVILILWLLGFLVGNVGSLIHLLLVIALILIILSLLGAI